jgi:FkbM family methyltransferase
MEPPKDLIISVYHDNPCHYSAVQIGANNGKCPNSRLFEKITSPLRILFVEPVPRLYEELIKYHNNKYPNNNFIYLNKAVTSKVDKVKIYYPSKTNDFAKLPWWIDQLSGTNPDHFKNHRYDIDLDMSYIPTTTFNQICKDLNIKSIDLLSIDTEGCDFDILMSIDFNVIKPKYIIFEHLHMSGYKTSGDKYEIVLKYLENNGYRVSHKNEEDTSVVYTGNN